MSTNPDSATSRKKWCVMVYFAADVDLESAALADLEQIDTSQRDTLEFGALEVA